MTSAYFPALKSSIPTERFLADAAGSFVIPGSEKHRQDGACELFSVEGGFCGHDAAVCYDVVMRDLGFIEGQHADSCRRFKTGGLFAGKKSRFSENDGCKTDRGCDLAGRADLIGYIDKFFIAPEFVLTADTAVDDDTVILSAGSTSFIVRSAWAISPCIP